MNRPLRITAAMTRRTRERAGNKMFAHERGLAWALDEGAADEEELYEVFEKECLAEILSAAQQNLGQISITSVFKSQFSRDPVMADETDRKYRKWFADRATLRGYEVTLSDDCMLVSWENKV
jgi:hypothetical protein